LTSLDRPWKDRDASAPGFFVFPRSLRKRKKNWGWFQLNRAQSSLPPPAMLFLAPLRAALLIALVIPAAAAPAQALPIPRLREAPVIDGDLAEWRERAFHDGVWDIHRVVHSPWYDGGVRNRLTAHGDEPAAEEDLAARYFIAWDDHFLYLGAEVRDNVNDTTDPKHEPKRWYYKDAIAWFIEAPRDDKSERFAEGDHGFAFVIDPKKPDYGVWWRHGAPDRTYIEEPLPAHAVDYKIRMNPWGRSAGDFILEARIDLAATCGKTDRRWTPPKIGDTYSLCIVHTDHDGGDYGGHLLIHGAGDDDVTWTPIVLTAPAEPILRKPQ